MKGGKWGTWGLGDSGPTRPTMKKKPGKTAAFRRWWGKWGLRARIKWRRFEIFILIPKTMRTDIIIPSLGITAILDPICPKSLFSAAFNARFGRIAKPHAPHEEAMTPLRPEGGRIRANHDLAEYP